MGSVHNSLRAHREKGMALLLCVLLLAALSLVAIAGAGDSRIQVRVAGNVSAERDARRAAESALAWAESWLHGLDGSAQPAPCPPDCGPGNPILAVDQLPPLVEHQSETWWLDNALADGIDPLSGTRLAERGRSLGPVGRWLIEEVHFEPAGQNGSGSPAVTYYRVIARATPRTAGTPVVVESIIARPWGDTRWRGAFPGGPGTPAYCIGIAVPAHCGRMAWRRKL